MNYKKQQAYVFMKKNQRKLHRDNFDKNPIRQVSYLIELVWTSNHLQRKVGTHSKYTKQMWLLLHMSSALKGTIKSLREEEYMRLKNILAVVQNHSDILEKKLAVGNGSA